MFKYKTPKLEVTIDVAAILRAIALFLLLL